MSSDRELSALIFELQRAASPVDRARALARAWRTIRRLSPTERRFLAREIGFDGAEELVEGLAGKGGGVFAPAAILEALGSMRRDRDFSIKNVLSDLKDPVKRDDLLVRGVDLVVDTLDDEPEPPPKPRPPLPTDEIAEAEFHEIPVGSTVGIDDAADVEQDESLGAAEEEYVPFDEIDDEPAAEPQLLNDDDPRLHGESEDESSIPPPPAVEPELEAEPVPEPEPDLEPEPKPEVPSLWDELRDAPDETVARVSTPTPVVRHQVAEPVTDAEDSVLDRLRSFRNEVLELHGVSNKTLAARLDRFPEPWARRRALVALIEAGIPAHVDDALDLIESLERPLDRRWCLAVLARCTDLTGDDLERALSMLTSPAAKRRVEGLVGR